MACYLNEAHRFKEAEEIQRRAIALWDGLLAESPGTPESRAGLGHSLWHMSHVLIATGQTSQVEKILRKALAVFEQLATDFPNDAYFKLETGWSCLANLGPFLATQSGRRKDAEQVFKRGLAAHEKLVTAYPKCDAELRGRLASNYDALVNILKADGRMQDALKVYRQAIDFYTRLVTNDPGGPAFRVALADAYGKVAGPLREAGQIPESEQAALKSVEIDEKLATIFPQESNYRLAAQRPCTRWRRPVPVTTPA